MKYLLPVVCSLFLIGCSDSAEAPATTETPPAAEAVAAPAEQTPVPEAAAEAAVQEAPATQTAAEPAPVVPDTPKAAPAKAAAPSAPSATVDGTALFTQKCASCHGMKAEKAALGKSQVIAGWSAQQVKDALKGYQAGTYGKEMKGLMQGQAKGLSDAQIDALAAHISGL